MSSTRSWREEIEPLVRKIEPGEERKVQEVASLKLVGVVWEPKDPEAIRALVEAAAKPG